MRVGLVRAQLDAALGAVENRPGELERFAPFGGKAAVSRIDAKCALQTDPSHYTLPRFLADVVARHEDRPALRFEGRSWSYREVESEVERLAKGLVAAGVVKGARVAVLMANRPEWVFAAFAIARVGGLLVPVSTFATAEERDHILRHSDTSLLLMQGELLRRDFAGELLERHEAIAGGRPGHVLCPALPQLRRIFALGLSQDRGAIEPFSRIQDPSGDVSSELVQALSDEVTPSDDGVLIYTSGTTQAPKGVLHYQRAPVIMSWRYAELYGLTPDDVIWTAQPFFWTAGIAMSLGSAFASGARLVLQETFDAGRALELFEREGVTLPFAWGHQEQALAEHPSIGDRDLQRLRRVNFNSPLAPIVGVTRDDWGFRGAYGLSETFTLLSAFRADDPALLRSRSSGPALPGMQIRIVDPESGAVCGTGEEGEIAARGLTRMCGYSKVAPELVFDDEGFFHTSDAGFIDDRGHLHWEGRLSNMIKTGGANVSPIEIEAALEQFPGLRVAQAVGVPHPVLGEAIVLCTSTGDANGVAEDEIREYLRGRLAAYKIPRVVLDFRESELSFTGNQKVQVGRLREAALERLQRDGVTIGGFRYAAPGS